MSEKERLATIKAQTASIGQQGYILTAPQKKAKIAQEYQARIDKANDGGDPAEAEGLAKERDAASFNVDVDEALMTPKEKRARDKANAKRDRAARTAQAGPGTHDANGPDGSMIHDANGPGGSMIPEAGTGSGAFESKASRNMDPIGEAHHISNHKQLPAHMKGFDPDASFDEFFHGGKQPNRTVNSPKARMLPKETRR